MKKMRCRGGWSQKKMRCKGGECVKKSADLPSPAFFTGTALMTFIMFIVDIEPVFKI